MIYAEKKNAYVLGIACHESGGAVKLDVKDLKHGGELIGNFRITCRKVSDEEYNQLIQQDETSN